MTYQDELARPMASAAGRCFDGSKVRIGADGHVGDVLWGEVDAGSSQKVGSSVFASATEVVDAIQDGAQLAAVFPAPGGRSSEASAGVCVRDRRT